MTLKYEFRPKSESQRLVMEATESNVLYDGPWGCGKTHAGAAKAYMAGLLYPNNRVALVRKKRVDLKATLWKWFIDKVLPPGVVVQQNDTDLYRRIVNGTEFFGVGLDSDTDVNKLASREYGLIIVEEAREISEEEATRRIMHNYEKGREWRRSYDRHERRKAKNTHVNAHDNREDKRG